jgi:hypothetical protein
MPQHYLKYDPTSGNITDDTGMMVACYPGAAPLSIDEKPESTSIDDMIKLKNSGFTAEEVIAIKKANL